MKVAALVPIKVHSRRVPFKNFLPLAGRPLCQYIFETLTDVPGVDVIYCYCSRPEILEFLPEKVAFLARPPYLDGDEILGGELFRYAVERIDADVILQTHATSPLVTAASIEKGLAAMREGACDSALAVQRIQAYSWYDGARLNYDAKNMLQTQDIKPVFVETGGFYIFSRRDYLETGSRVGARPHLVEVDEIEAVDVDDPIQFEIAERLMASRSNSIFPRPHFMTLHKLGAVPGEFRHVSFDLDGVLINSIGVMETAWGAVKQELGLPQPFSAYAAHIGIPFNEILANIGVPSELFGRVFEVYDAASRANIENIALYDGVVDILREIKARGLKTTVVTSKPERRTRQILDRFELASYFDAVVCADDAEVKRGKPAPDSLMLACVRVGGIPRETVYIGDTAVDQAAAANAGTSFYAAGWGYGVFEDKKVVSVEKPADLLGFLSM